ALGHHPGIPPGDFAHRDTIESSTRGDIQSGA
ncbi:GntR family transcriptional regulator, partial [Streptomyces sp. MBT62]|nr:GntR family transcriptional regulator [Streptomyces sp. MBT62]